MLTFSVPKMFLVKILAGVKPRHVEITRGRLLVLQSTEQGLKAVQQS